MMTAHDGTDPEALAKTVRRAELLRRLAIVSALVVNAAVLGLLVTMVLLIRYTQTEGSPGQQRLINISKQIASCTTESGACAARQAKQTGKALQSIDKNTENTLILGLVCQERLHTQDPKTLARCVDDLRK